MPVKTLEATADGELEITLTARGVVLKQGTNVVRLPWRKLEALKDAMNSLVNAHRWLHAVNHDDTAAAK